MDAATLRESTKTTVESLGYQFNPNLPILDEVHIQRDCQAISERILSLYACVACAYGFSKATAIEWLSRESLWESLTESEQEFLEGRAEPSKSTIQWQVEALWSLTWAAGYHNILDFSSPCPDSFIQLFPDLKKWEGTANFKAKCKLRPPEELSKKLDLSYCLHWAICDSKLSGSDSRRGVNKIEGQVIVERRRALEWIISDDDWDEVSLST